MNEIYLKRLGPLRTKHFKNRFSIIKRRDLIRFERKRLNFKSRTASKPYSNSKSVLFSFMCIFVEHVIWITENLCNSLQIFLCCHPALRLNLNANVRMHLREFICTHFTWTLLTVCSILISSWNFRMHQTEFRCGISTLQCGNWT